MTRLSVNLNKIALLRNSRTSGIPSVLRAAELSIAAGAQGITVHPRPDQRHVRTSDVYELADYLSDFPNIEFNVEGNPFPEFLKLVQEVKPAQCTLVPDDRDAVTSEQGWLLNIEDRERLAAVIERLQGIGARVSLFMNPDSDRWQAVSDLGAERVELNTRFYAEAFTGAGSEAIFAKYAAAAKAAQLSGLGVNAGHDLNLQNLGQFCTISGILEVSIGHALVSDALEMGLPEAVRAYLRVLAMNSSHATAQQLEIPKSAA